MLLHEKLRYLRKQIERPLAHVQKHTGISRNQLAKLESGEADNPQIQTLQVLAKYHGITVVELLRETQYDLKGGRL